MEREQWKEAEAFQQKVQDEALISLQNDASRAIQEIFCDYEDPEAKPALQKIRDELDHLISLL